MADIDDVLDSTTVSQQTIGQTLKSIREDQRISINEVAQNLLLSRQIIVAIEADDYSNIAAQVYAEGYLKAYAQFLHIPVDTIITSFRRLNIYSMPEIKIEEKARTRVNEWWKWQELLALAKNRHAIPVILGILAFLILSTLIFYIGKHVGRRGVITGVSSVSGNITNEVNKTIPDSLVPIITTNTSEDIVTSESEKPVAQKNNSRETNRQQEI